VIVNRRTTTPRYAVLAAAIGATLAFAEGTWAADGGAETARRALVVARVGDGPKARAITLGDVEDGIASMPPFQRAMFGATPDVVRRAFLADVLVRGALLDEAADVDGVAANQAVAYAIDRARSNATLRALRASAPAASAIPMSEVQAYYDENRARYDAPERVQVWRILCATREEADTVLAAAIATPTPKAFAELAREHSKDRATYLRGGNLGFLDTDGVSNEPGLKVDPGVARAAQGVRDGDFVKTPVAEGSYYAVVWRRGSTPAVHQKVQDVAAQIRDALRRLRVKADADALLARRRASDVRDKDTELLLIPELVPSAGPPPPVPSR
jgi:peptidyl-prolyl cis-trans isomerase C